MLVEIPDVLSAAELAECRRVLAEADWIDGRVTAGHQAAKVKNNAQVPEAHPAARALGDMIVGKLERLPLFISAALPLKVFPPIFNRYGGGQHFGTHVDTAIRQVPGSAHRVRTDLSLTLFLTDPDDYEGGELVVDDSYGAHAVKLAAGSMVLYPGSSLHHVAPVTRGERVSAISWVQSMIRDEGQRGILFDLDSAIQRVIGTQADEQTVTQLTGVYHNLLRRWADV